LLLYVAKIYISTMDRKKIERELQKLKQEIINTGIPIPGSIQTSYRRCGKKNCRCQKPDDKGHGPYYVWYRREDKKLTTKSLAAENVSLYQEWIDNRETIEMVVKKIIILGANYAVAFKKSEINSKKTDSPKRGK
jgi:hypothetical protein